MVKDGDKIVLAVECKATKLTYLAQFAEDPFEAEKNQYLQIAKGAFQLWRFFSHVRRGLVKEPVDPSTSAMVLTLDSFLTISRELKAKIIEEATSLADKEGDIAAEDRRHVIFCPIPDLEEILSRLAQRRASWQLSRRRGNRNTLGWELREVIGNKWRGRRRSSRRSFLSIGRPLAVVEAV